MAYKVLARKWRPRTFEDLVGQEFPALTLKNSIESEKIAHALIFAGSRGTGKTSTARIVAKAVNCERKDRGQYPCSEDPCGSCEEISEGKCLDVQEIDAASHTGVADVREIIESVKYMPAAAAKKVYIIDEVHMLSQSAFNALLKIMEEPPEHALFILATTEAHKVPPTIMSRCQRYDFKKIPVEKIKRSLEKITEAEELMIDSETLYLIARESEGSMRDSLSLLDQLAASFAGEIKHDEVIRLLGIPDKESLKSVLRAVFEKDAARCVELARDAAAKGISPRRMSHDLIHLFKNLVYLKICGRDFRSELSDDEKKDLFEIVRNESAETVELLFNIMIDAGERIRGSSYPEIVLELGLVKMSTIGKVEKIDDMIKRLEKLAGGAPAGGGRSPGADSGRSETRSRAPEKNRKEAAPPPEEKAGGGESAEREGPVLSDPAAALAEGGSLGKEQVVALVNTRDRFLARKLGQAHSLEVKGRNVRIKFLKNGMNYQSEFRKDDKLKNVLREALALDSVILDVETVNGEAAGGGKPPAKKREAPADDPVVSRAIREFDAVVINRKTLVKE